MTKKYISINILAVPSTKFKQLSDGLFIKSVTETDDGEYTCRAFQISETVTDVQDKTILLRIQSKYFIKTEKKINKRKVLGI